MIIKEKLQFNKHPKIKPQFNPLRIPTHVLNTNPQLWITHPLPLSGLTCLLTAIAASLAIPWDSSSFSSDYSNRVPKHQWDVEGIEASICTVLVRFLFLSPWILSRKSERWKCAKLNHEPDTKLSWKSNG